jgi:hypothetical protein
MSKIRNIFRFIRRHLEAFIWIAALVALAFTDPMGTHYSLCPLHNMGFDWCPGCGLGHSISWLFRGDIVESFHAHPLGIPAVFIIILRIITIFRNNSKYNSYIYPKSIQND